MKLYLTLFILLTTSFAWGQLKEYDLYSLSPAIDSSNIPFDDYDNFTVAVAFFDKSCQYTKYYLNKYDSLYQSFKNDSVFFFIIETARNIKKNGLKVFKNGNSNSPLYIYFDRINWYSRRMNVQKTPYFILLKRHENKFVEVYKGPLDDNPDFMLKTDDYLHEALQSDTTLQAPNPFGCIRKKY